MSMNRDLILIPAKRRENHDARSIILNTEARRAERKEIDNA